MLRTSSRRIQGYSSSAQVDSTGSRQDILDMGALLKRNRAMDALKLWQKRPPGSSPELTEIGIRTICACFRMTEAEQLANALPSKSRVSPFFIEAYAKLGQETRVSEWLAILLNDKLASRSVFNRVLLTLAKVKMWAQVQSVMRFMGESGVPIDPKLASALVAASGEMIGSKGIAAVLAQDGSLINMPMFKRALGTDIRTRVDRLLARDDVVGAIKVASEYRGIHMLSVCYKILRYLTPLASANAEDFRLLVQPLFEAVVSPPRVTSGYVQFILLYLNAVRDYGELWDFVRRYQLVSEFADVVDGPSSSNDYLLWKIIRQHISTRRQLSITFSLRDYAVVTATRTPLTVPILRTILLSLEAQGDIPALVTLLEFSHTVEGSPIPAEFIAHIFPSSPLGHAPDNLERLTQQICEKHGITYQAVRIQSAEMRQKLLMNTVY